MSLTLAKDMPAFTASLIARILWIPLMIAIACCSVLFSVSYFNATEGYRRMGIIPSESNEFLHHPDTWIVLFLTAFIVMACLISAIKTTLSLNKK
jgi:hypothetical protein